MCPSVYSLAFQLLGGCNYCVQPVVQVNGCIWPPYGEHWCKEASAFTYLMEQDISPVQIWGLGKISYVHVFSVTIHSIEASYVQVF